MFMGGSLKTWRVLVPYEHLVSLLFVVFASYPYFLNLMFWVVLLNLEGFSTIWTFGFFVFCRLCSHFYIYFLHSTLFHFLRLYLVLFIFLLNVLRWFFINLEGFSTIWTFSFSVYA